MSESDGSDEGPRTPGRHRAVVDSRRRLLTRLIAPLVAVAVVVAVILIVIALNGHSAGSGPGPGVITAGTSPVVTASPTVTVSPVSPTHSTPPTTSSPAPSARRGVAASDRQAMAPVRVLNNSRITGLAHDVASRLVARGWDVTSVANEQRIFAVTSLYYDAGHRAAARHLAREFPGIRRVKSNRAAGIHASGLTLILTRDWRE